LEKSVLLSPGCKKRHSWRGLLKEWLPGLAHSRIVTLRVAARHPGCVLSRAATTELVKDRWRLAELSVAILGVITLAIEFAENKLCG